MNSLKRKHYSIEVYDRPGIKLHPFELRKLQKELIEIGKESLDTIPNYQCFSENLDEFKRLIISVARNNAGKAIAFCSSYILDAGEIGKVLHLGLTCIGPEARGLGLTHKLTSKIIYRYFITHARFGTFWVSNVACVLSSLGNVALHFEDVYPSPYLSSPTQKHKIIATTINHHYRQELYINPCSEFDHNSFIFHGSVKGTTFQKGKDDQQFHHRDKKINSYFQNLINFNNGDEILQIGRVSLLSYPKYLLKNRKKNNAFIKEKSPKLNVA